ASSQENKDGSFNPETGLSYFADAIDQAWSMGQDGYLIGDMNHMNGISFEELAWWVENGYEIDGLEGTLVRTTGIGADPDELVRFTQDVWNPIRFKTDAFQGTLGTSVPETTPMFLLGLGLLELAGVRRKIQK